MGKSKKEKKGRGDVSVAAAQTEADLRHTLLQFFVCYAPERLLEIPALMHRYPYKTKAAEITMQLSTDFGQVPVDGEARLCLINDLRTRLFVFYGHHAPEKFPEIDELIFKYHGREGELWSALEKKYGPEKPLDDLFAKWEEEYDEEGNLKNVKRSSADEPDTRVWKKPTPSSPRAHRKSMRQLNRHASVLSDDESSSVMSSPKGAAGHRHVSFVEDPRAMRSSAAGGKSGVEGDDSDDHHLISPNASAIANDTTFGDIPWATSSTFDPSAGAGPQHSASLSSESKENTTPQSTAEEVRDQTDKEDPHEKETKQMLGFSLEDEDHQTLQQDYSRLLAKVGVNTAGPAAGFEQPPTAADPFGALTPEKDRKSKSFLGTTLFTGKKEKAPRMFSFYSEQELLELPPEPLKEFRTPLPPEGDYSNPGSPVLVPPPKQSQQQLQYRYQQQFPRRPVSSSGEHAVKSSPAASPDGAQLQQLLRRAGVQNISTESSQSWVSADDFDRL